MSKIIFDYPSTYPKLLELSIGCVQLAYLNTLWLLFLLCLCVASSGPFVICTFIFSGVSIPLLLLAAKDFNDATFAPPDEIAGNYRNGVSKLSVSFLWAAVFTCLGLYAGGL